MASKPKSKPYSVRRYVIRILIPTSIVVAVALGMRWWLIGAFNESNVRTVDSTPSTGSLTEGEKSGFPYENKAQAIAGLRESEELLGKAFETNALDVDEVEKRRHSEARKELSNRIHELETAVEENWDERLVQAYDALEKLSEASKVQRSGEQ